MSYFLGLDLGTTFTAAAVWRDGQCQVSALGNRAAVIPSVVHLSADGTTVVGETAQRRSLTDPLRVAREFKRRFGDPTPLLLGGSPMSSEALTARLAAAVVEMVSEREGARPDRISVTHPATWGPFKRDLLEQSMRLAGLRDGTDLVVSYLSEPEAAAWEYAASRPLAPGSAVAVYDLGGGTFDATVLRAGPDGFELLGEPEGIERLGGIDIDQAVFSFVVDALGGVVDTLDTEDPMTLGALNRLRADCVDAKEALSSDHETSVAVALPGLQTEVRITRPELEAIIRPVIGDTVAAMRRALDTAGIDAADLDGVLLVGGSSRVPLVGELVSQMLGRPVAVDTHPKHVVALGAARHAAAGGRFDLISAPSAAAPIVIEPEPVPVPVPVPEPEPEPVPVPEPEPEPAIEPEIVEPAPIEPSFADSPAAAAPVAGSPFGSGRGEPPPVSATPTPAPRGRGRLLALLGVAALAVVAVVGAAIAFSGGGGGDGCPDGGPFVCITEVARAGGGGLVARFDPIDVTPGADGATLVFFLADRAQTDAGVAAVNAGLPIPWTSAAPFEGWSDAELQGRAVVCAVVLQGSDLVAGSGNCVAVPG